MAFCCGLCKLFWIQHAALMCVLDWLVWQSLQCCCQHKEDAGLLLQLRNLLWATSKHDLYFMHEHTVKHWSSLTRATTEVDQPGPLHYTIQPQTVVMQLPDPAHRMRCNVSGSVSSHPRQILAVCWCSVCDKRDLDCIASNVVQAKQQHDCLH